MMIDDPRVRTYVAPARVQWPAPAPQPPAGAERLCTESLIQPTVWRPALCVLSHNVAGKPESPMLLCDFGREIHGGVQLIVRNTMNNKPVQVKITFGESIAETLATPNQDHAIHQFITELPWAGIHEIGCTGFRFVRIELTKPGTFVELHGVRAVTLMRPDVPVGSFECNDTRLNTIWQTGVHTLQLCMQQHLWDGAKRDRLVWAGDLHPEVMAVLATFGPHAIVPESIDFLREDAPLPNWMNSMPTYSMWWLISLRDWWMHTADTALLERNRAYILPLIDNIVAHVSATGHDTLPSRFLDWASAKDPEAVKVGTNALLRLTACAGADLCRALGEVRIGDRLDVIADRIGRAAQPAVRNQQANAMRVLAGLSDAEQTNSDIFAPDPAAGLSPFYGYYVLEARAMAGDYVGCLDLLRTYWGGMLDLGATTFWEHFDQAWIDDKPTRIDEWPIEGRKDVHRDYGEYCYEGFRHSLCHAWAAGPTPWLTRHVLGVTPAAPGFGRVQIKPNLGDLQWARGTVPTPHGPIHVSHERADDGTIESQIELPDGVRREVQSPAKIFAVA